MKGYKLETQGNGLFVTIREGESSLFLQEEDAAQFLAELESLETKSTQELTRLGFRDALSAVMYLYGYDGLMAEDNAP